MPIEIPFLDFTVILFRVDEINKLILLTFAVTGVLSFVYASSQRRAGLFVAVAVHSIAGAMALMAGDFISFLVFWELLTLSSYFIISLNRTPASLSASFRYILIHMLGAAAFFLGLVVQFGATGSMELQSAVPEASPYFLIAIAIKTVFIPLHFWLPDSYPHAPFRGSVFLSIFTTKVGVYALAVVLGGGSLAYMGGLMALFGVIGALRQRFSRRLLAYHIISQIGYMVAAVGLSTDLGLVAGFMHVSNHVVYKALLFMVVGAVIYRVGSEDLFSLGGLARKMPITFVCAVVAASAIAGVPLFSGYASKDLIKAAAGYTPLTYMLMAASVGTALSFAKLIFYTFIEKPRVDISKVKEVPVCMLIPMVLLASYSIFAGVQPNRILALLPDSPIHSFYSAASVLSGLFPPIVGVLVFIVAGDLIRPFSRGDGPLRAQFIMVRSFTEKASGLLARTHPGDIQIYIIAVLVTFLVITIVTTVSLFH